LAYYTHNIVTRIAGVRASVSLVAECIVLFDLYTDSPGAGFQETI